MTRQKFCSTLVKAKESAYVSLTEAIQNARTLSFKKIDIIECGLNNFNLSDALFYLRMCHCTIEMNGYDMIFADTLEEISNFFIAERKWQELSVVDVARNSHVSSKIIYAFEKGRCDLKIDTFLKLIDALNITIEID